MNLDEARFDQLHIQRQDRADLAFDFGKDFIEAVVKQANIRPTPRYVMREAKRRNRVRRKVLKYLNKDPNLDLQEAVNKVDDYAGGRLLAHYVHDIRQMHQLVCALVSSRSDISITEGCDDRLKTPNERGSRLLKQPLWIQLGPSEWFPFELQFMTYLQHDWDQRQHQIYEDPEVFPENVKQRYFNLSGRLDNVEVEFTRIRKAVESYLEDQGASP